MNNTIMIKFCPPELTDLFIEWFSLDEGNKIRFYNFCESRGYCFTKTSIDKCNIVETHKPIRRKARLPEKNGESIGVFYCPSVLSENLHHEYYWVNDDFDNLMLKRGLVFSTKEAAIQNAKAMLGIDPKGEE